MSSKKSSESISEYVYLTNVYYTNKQNKTKELYFRCLDEGRSYEYFEEELGKIWDNINHKFMGKQIEELRKIVNSANVEEAINLGRLDSKYKETEYWVIDDEYFRLTPESDFREFEQRFKRNVLNNYKSAQATLKNYDKESYLNKKIDTYNKSVNQIVTYFNRSGTIARKVQLSTYLSMIHNVNLTRSGWNQTMSDSERLGKNLFIIPYHPYSCIECISWQNRILTKEMVENIIGIEAIEQAGDILHPNCKCTLSIYWDSIQIDKPKYSTIELENQYKARQKVNSLTLEKSNLRADYHIAKSLGNEEKADKVKAKINAINRSIREIRKLMPSESLKKQLAAIKR